jgi:hypothetical protein
MNWVFDGGRVHWADWEIVAALPHPATEIVDEAAVTDVTEWARFTATAPTGCRVAVSVADLPGPAAPAATALTVFVAARCATSKMINYLLPEAAERFLEVGYEPYRPALGGHFGSTVRYAFFDQPHGLLLPLAPAPRACRQLAGVRADAGRAVRRGARSALSPLAVGPGTRRRAEHGGARRCDFFATNSELGIDSFFGTLSRWCRRHGIALSGHEVLGYVSSWDFTGTVITDDPRTNFGLERPRRRAGSPAPVGRGSAARLVTRH